MKENNSNDLFWFVLMVSLYIGSLVFIIFDIERLEKINNEQNEKINQIYEKLNK